MPLASKACSASVMPILWVTRLQTHRDVDVPSVIYVTAARVDFLSPPKAPSSHNFMVSALKGGDAMPSTMSRR